MATKALSGAVKSLRDNVEAQGRVARRTVGGNGRYVVNRQVVEGAEDALPRSIEDLVRLFSRGHARTARIFANVEEAFEAVLAKPTGAMAKHARLRMDELETEWRVAREELREILRSRSAAPGLGPTEAEASARDLIGRLDDHFNSRFGFSNYTSLIPYDRPPAEMRRIIREELARTTTAPDLLEEFTQYATSLPFLQRPELPPTKSAARGREAVREARQFQQEVLKARPAAPGVTGAPGKPVNRATVAREAQALDELARFHPEGDVLYDDVVDMVDAGAAAQRAKAGPGGLSTQAFVDDMVNKVQGRIGEALALKHPEFHANVWKAAQRTANDVCERLNRSLADVPEPQRWVTRVITEPCVGTGMRGQAGELMDSGVWLVRSGPDGNFAMPVFALEVKSGEIRTSISQQVLDRVRASGGLVQLPGTNETYKMTLPPAKEFQSALASTRTITSQRMLGEIEKGGQAAVQVLTESPLYTFQLPMRRSDIRAAATALVNARLAQLMKAIK